MDAVAVRGARVPSVKPFDQIVEIRAERHEHLRGRNNVTSCRSPTRESEMVRIKNELKEKRHLEFQRRRSVSPEPTASGCKNTSLSTKSSTKTCSLRHYSSTRSSKTNFLKSPTNNGQAVIISTPSVTTDGQSSNIWASWWSEHITAISHEKDHAASTSTQKTVNAQKTAIRTSRQTEKTLQKFSLQSENTLPKKILRDAGVQTEPGLLSVKETDVQQLAEYLKEALWREEAVKKKLAALQESTSNLMNSSKLTWTARCSEDLLKNKIKALEAQLQVCLQKVPKDALKKLVIQMEKQKLVYEETAIVALQKATQEKAKAASRAATLEEALNNAKAEAVRWQSLYEELRLSAGQLRENQHLKDEQLQQLQSQVELSRARETELKEEVESLREQRQELQYNIHLLEDDNQTLREEIQQLRDDTSESHDFMMLRCPPPEETEPQLTLRRDSQVEEQLRHVQEKLRLKDAECEELQSELHAMEQECQSSQARLSQCREELRQLSHRQRRPTPCVRWWKVCLFFLLLVVLVEVAMLWLWYPPFREQVEDFYSDMETRLDEYLREMASPQNSGCFRPI